ncbi:hypothetical protein GCM10010191_22230 [Actinomadura vinacea]|uniref:FAD-binding domain-containing protein n=1 Tax=Actinomadura vinacea TaxID=115336 RepID=A0ABP5VUV6_9ACTN
MTAAAPEPVLIVGARPTGLTAAILLARPGVRSHVVERHPTSTRGRARPRSSSSPTGTVFTAPPATGRPAPNRLTLLSSSPHNGSPIHARGEAPL